MAGDKRNKNEEKCLLKNGRLLLKEMFDGLSYSYPQLDVYPESHVVGLRPVSDSYYSTYDFYFNLVN